MFIKTYIATCTFTTDSFTSSDTSVVLDFILYPRFADSFLLSFRCDRHAFWQSIFLYLYACWAIRAEITRVVTVADARMAKALDLSTKQHSAFPYICHSQGGASSHPTCLRHLCWTAHAQSCKTMVSSLLIAKWVECELGVCTHRQYTILWGCPLTVLGKAAPPPSLGWWARTFDHFVFFDALAMIIDQTLNPPAEWLISYLFMW